MRYTVFDCRYVGVLYLSLALISGILGFGFSACMRYELLFPFDLVSDEAYYVCLTSHAVMMVFFFLTVSANGFFNILLPGFLFCSDFFFPRANLLSLLLLFISFFFVVLSLLLGGVGGGWTLYPPLSFLGFGGSMDVFVLSVHFFTFSSVLSSVNILCTVFFFKCSSLRYLDLGVFIWSAVITSFLNILSLPYFSSVLTMLLFDRCLNTVFFNPVFGGDPLLFQSLFWFWGHPEVYILVIPVFGLVSLVVGYLVDNEFIFGHYCIVVSLMSIGFLGFLVWGHHMVTVGWGSDLKSFFMASTVAISIPTGLKIFNWICSLYFYGSFQNINNVFFYFVYVFIVFFVLGGSSGIILSNYTVDVLLHDTYFVVGHFHFVLSLASVLGFIMALVFFWPVITCGCELDYDLILVFLLGFFFFSLFTFFPFHFLGISGCPRRVFCYCDGFFPWFYVSSLGFAGLTLNLFFFIFVLFSSLNGEGGAFFFYRFSVCCFNSFCIVYSFIGFFIISFVYICVFWANKRGCYKTKDASNTEPLYTCLDQDFRHRHGVDPCQSDSTFKTANWDFYKDAFNAYTFHSIRALGGLFGIFARFRVGSQFKNLILFEKNDVNLFHFYCFLCIFLLLFSIFYIPFDLLVNGNFRIESNFFTYLEATGELGVFDSYYGRCLFTANFNLVRFINFFFFTFSFVIAPFFILPRVFLEINRYFYVIFFLLCLLIFYFEFLQFSFLFIVSFFSCLSPFFKFISKSKFSFFCEFYAYLRYFFILFFYSLFLFGGFNVGLFVFTFVIFINLVFILFFNLVLFSFFLVYVLFSGLSKFYPFCLMVKCLFLFHFNNLVDCFYFISSFKFNFDGFLYKFMNYFFSDFFKSIKPHFREIKGMGFKEFVAYVILFFQFVIFVSVSSMFTGWMAYNLIGDAYFLFLNVFGLFACTAFYMGIIPLLNYSYTGAFNHFYGGLSGFEEEERPIRRFAIKFNWVYSIAWWYFLFSFLILMGGLICSVYCNFTPGVVSLYFWTGFALMSFYYLCTPFVFIFFLYCFVYGTNFSHEVAFKCLLRFIYVKGGLFFYLLFKFFFSHHVLEIPFFKLFFIIFLFFYDLADLLLVSLGLYPLQSELASLTSSPRSLVSAGNGSLIFRFFLLLVVLAFCGIVLFYLLFWLKFSPHLLVYYILCFFVFSLICLFVMWYFYHRAVADLGLIFLFLCDCVFYIIPKLVLLFFVIIFFVIHFTFLIPVTLLNDMRFVKCFLLLKTIYYFLISLFSIFCLLVITILYVVYDSFLEPLFAFLSFFFDFLCMIFEHLCEEARKHFSGKK